MKSVKPIDKIGGITGVAVSTRSEITELADVCIDEDAVNMSGYIPITASLEMIPVMKPFT